MHLPGSSFYHSGTFSRCAARSLGFNIEETSVVLSAVVFVDSVCGVDSDSGYSHRDLDIREVYTIPTFAGALIVRDACVGIL